MQINNLKNISAGPRFFTKLLVVLLSISTIVFSYYILEKASKDAINTVDVVRIKAPDGIYEGVMIDESMVQKYKLIKKEFTDDMVTYDKVDEVINKYSLYYLRDKSIIYTNQYTKDRPLRNEWVYDIPQDSEILTLPYNYLECAGDILTPGDNIRIRIAYDEDANQVNDSAMFVNRKGGIVRKTEVLFESLKVRDLLNSKGHSIYEVYKEVMKLPHEEKQEVLKSKDFLLNILPRSLVLEGTREQINKYSLYSNKKDSTFTITLLGREEKSTIFDQIPTVEKEIESWITEKM